MRFYLLTEEQLERLEALVWDAQMTQFAETVEMIKRQMVDVKGPAE